MMVRARHPLQASLLALLLILVAGCGFQLRGTVDALPPEWTALHLQTPSPNSELSNAINNGLSAAGVTMVPRDEASYVLQVSSERFERSNLTVGANARASEFELEMTTTLAVRDSSGVEILAPSEIKTFKVMTNNINNVTGKVEEMRLLQQEMRRDLANTIIRRIRFLASNSGDA